MRVKYLFLCGLLFPGLTGCRDNNREQRLLERERALLEREKQFERKDANYRSLLKMRDSLLALQDSASVKIWPANIAGNWNSKVICKESNCSNYVIGDQRSDIWEFSNDSTGMFTKVISKNNLVRVFSGQVNKEDILLHFATDSTADKKVEMKVSLQLAGKGLMKGVQVISVDNDCKASFSVDLVQVSK
ncbi:MAG TPA: hypothetical protein PK339_14675 [Flavitalea sp.]|nr:hypothetical protein [Flavitalea sp.]